MKEFYLVCYDISDERRLQRVAKVMEDYGTRVLYSVFECFLTPSEFEAMKKTVEAIMDELDDKVRYYKLCASCRRPFVHLGYGKFRRAENDDALVI